MNQQLDPLEVKRQKRAFWSGSLVMIFSALLYSMSNGHVSTNMPFIQKSLNVSYSSASWVVNIEMLICVITTAFSGPLGQYLGTPRVFFMGMLVFGLFNTLFFIPQCETNYALVMTFRVFSSIGLGLFLPLQMPVGLTVIPKQKFATALSLCSIALPIGVIGISLVSSWIAKVSSWRWLFVGVGILTFCQSIFVFFRMPMRFPGNKSIKIDFLGCFLLALGLSGVVLGLMQLEGEGFMPQWAAGVLLTAAVCILALFLVYNIKWSKNSVFPKAVFNRSTLIMCFQILFGNIAKYGSSYMISYVQFYVIGVKQENIGLWSALSQTGFIFMAPFGNLLHRKLVSKQVIILLFSGFLLIDILQALQITFWANIGAFVALLFFESGMFCILLITGQATNVGAAPAQYQNSLGVLTQLMSNLGHSMGVTLAVLVSGLLQKDFELKYAYSGVYWMYSVLIALVLILSLFGGVFQFERGKRGYREIVALNANTFDENLVNPTEVEEVQEFSGEQKQTKIEKIINLFATGYVY